MDTNSLPEWAQFAGIVAVALVAAIVGVYNYLKTQIKADSTSSSPLTASLIDSKLLRELIEAIRESQDEQSRDTKKSHRLSQDLKESVNELNETIIVQTDATINLVKFINRESNRNRAAETMNLIEGIK